MLNILHNNMISLKLHFFSCKTVVKEDFAVNIVNMFSFDTVIYAFIFILGTHLECPLGSYGRNCSQTCSKKCYMFRTCDKKTGSCHGGCVQGWKPPLCDKGICITIFRARIF